MNGSWIPSRISGVALLSAFLCTVAYLAPGPRASAEPVSTPIEEQIQLVDRLRGKPSADLADALYNLAAKYNHAGDNASALQYLQQSLAVEKQLKRPKSQLNTLIEIGNVELAQHEPDAALSEFKEALTFARQNMDSGAVGDAYNSVATAYLKDGKFSDAQSYLSEGLSNCTSAKTGEVRAGLLINRAAVNRALGQQEQALADLKEAAKLIVDQQKDDSFQTAESDELHLRTLANLAAMQHDVGRFDESVATYKSLDALAAGMLDPCNRALAAWGIGEDEFDQQNIDEALKSYQTAVSLTGDCRDRADVRVSALLGLGSAQAAMERLSEAEQSHKKALEIAQQQDNVMLQVQALEQLASDYLAQGTAEQALDLVLQANELLPKLPGNPTKIKALLNTTSGRCYRALGEMQAAERFYQQALGEYKAINEHDYELYVLNNLATLYLDNCDLQRFSTIYADVEKLLANNTDPGAQRQRAIAQYTLGQSQLMQEKYADADKTFSSALANAKESTDLGLRSSILRGLGLAQYLSHDYQNCIESYKQAAMLSQGSKSIESQWDCNLGLGKAYKAIKQYDKAESCLKNAVDVVEKERLGLTRDSFKTNNLDFRSDCYIELVDLYYLTDKPEHALAVAELGKARAFLDLLSNKQQRRIDSANSGGGQGIEIASLQAGEAGSRSIAVTPKASEAVEETAISPIHSQAPTIAEIKALVTKHGSTCIEYMLSGTTLYMWVVQPDGTVRMPPPVALPPDFRKQVATALQQITVTPKTPAQANAQGVVRQADLHSLYGILIKPVESYLPKDPEAIVTIVPHRTLFSVPFAALMADDGTFLIEKHTLSYLPALGVLRGTLQLEDKVGSKPSKLLAFGNPITKQIAFLGALPYAEKEVKHIASLYAPGTATVEVGADATKEQFVNLLPGASEIHLATHGLVDEEHPMHSAVVLAPQGSDSGLLSVRDILLLKNLEARLVVLSACQTGRGKVTGDGVVGLSRAFIIAGTPSVLVSQWNVDDVMTEYQMTHFYQSYLKGTNKARALRAAQLSTIKAMEPSSPAVDGKDDPHYVRANPRFWAAFQLIGSAK